MSKKCFAAITSSGMNSELLTHFSSITSFLAKEGLILRTNIWDGDINGSLQSFIDENREYDVVVADMNDESQPIYEIIKYRDGRLSNTNKAINSNLEATDGVSLKRIYEFEALLTGCYDDVGKPAFLLCWSTPNSPNAEVEKQEYDIETEKAIAMAEEYGVPVVNMNTTTWLQLIAKLIE